MVDYDPLVWATMCPHLADAVELSVVELRDVADVRSYKPICNGVYLSSMGHHFPKKALVGPWT